MAGEGRITKNQVAEKDVYGDVRKSADAAEKSVKSLNVQLKANQEAAKKTKSALKSSGAGAPKPKDIKSLRDLNDLTRRSNTLAKNKLDIDKKLQKRRVELQESRKRMNKSLREEIALENKQIGTLEKLEIQNKQLTERVKGLDLATKKGQRSARNLNRQIDRNNKVIERNSDAMSRQRKGIGRYSKAVNGLRSGLARMGVAFGAFQLIRGSFDVIKDFEQAQADLASVLGVNTDEMAGLTEQAKQLGATTTFTASQVSELQKELAKLGFTQVEIGQMTEATLLLAEATGTDLARAAEVTGATLNGFGLAATDTQRVVDVMAKSFSSSSLDMEKFSTAMAAVAPIAKTMGFSVEQTTAMLGALTDSGLDASTAGTSLRNMMLEARKQGLTWKEALDKVNNSQDKASTSLELFGKRGVAAGVILAENQEKVSGLTEKLLDADDAARKMAETQRNTLSGALKLLQSAWEGQVLAMNEAGGVGDKLRKTIVFMSENLDSILSVLGKVIKAFVIFKTTMFALKMSERISDFVDFRKSIKKSGAATKGATRDIKNFSRSLKAIGWAAVVAGALALAQAFWKAVTGARALQIETNKIEKSISESTESSTKFLDSLSKKQDERIAQLQRERNEGKITEKEFIKGKRASISASEKELKQAINSVTRRRTENTKLFFERKSQLKDLERQQNAGLIPIAEMQKALGEFEQSIGLESITGSVSKRFIRLTREISQQKANIEAGQNKIDLYNEALKELGESNKDAASDVNALNVELEDQKDKSVDLSREIRDEQISQIKDVFTQQEAAAIAAASNRIEDTKKLIASEKQKSELIIEINESLGIELKKIAKERTDFLIEENNRLVEAISDSQEEIKIEAEKFLTEESVFEKELKELELSLLESGKTQNEIQEEITEKEIEQLKKRIEERKNVGEDTLDLELDLARKQQKIEADAFKERADNLKEFLQISTDLIVKNIDARIKKLDEETKAHEKQADVLQELAINGNIEAKDSLAVEQQLIEQANAQKAEEERRKQQVLLATSILQAFNANLAAGDDSGTAFTKAITSTTVLSQFIAALPEFLEGSDDLGTVSSPLDSNGGRLVIAHDNERIMTKEQNKQIGNYSNDYVARVMEKHRLGEYIGDGQIMQGYESQALVSGIMSMNKGIGKVEKAIGNIPENHNEMGRITQSYMTMVNRQKRGGRTTNSIFKARSKE